MTDEQTEPDTVDRTDEVPRYKITMVGNIHQTISSIIELHRLVRYSIDHGFTPTIEYSVRCCDEQPDPNPSRKATKMMTAEDPELFEAGYRHVQDMAPRADGWNGTAPWWYGWAVREAFWAGAKW